MKKLLKQSTNNNLKFANLSFVYSSYSRFAVAFTVAFIFICFSFSQTAHAVSLSLGNIDVSRVSFSSTGQPASEVAKTFDGDTSTEGWIIGDTKVNSISSIAWEFNQPTPTLDPGQSVAHYTYSITFHWGRDSQRSPKHFALRAKTDNDPERVEITQYESLSTNYGSNTISLASPTDKPWIIGGQGGTVPGTVKTTQPDPNNPLVTHTMVFRRNAAITLLEIMVPQNSGWSQNSHIALNEITGTIVAEVVPEPSTYALITGLAVFAFVASKRKRQAQN